MIKATLPWQNMGATHAKSQSEILDEMKEHYWGPRLLTGLPDAFTQLGKLITGMSEKDHPPYDEMIQLMLIVNSGEGIFQLQEDDVFSVNWKTQSLGLDFSNKNNISLFHQLEGFRYDPDDKVPDSDKLEFRQLKKYPPTKEGPFQDPYLYIGEVNRTTFLPSGRGILIMEFGDIFQGHFKNGVPCGRCRWIKGVAYEGEFNSFFPSVNTLYTIRYLQSSDTLVGYFDI